MAFQQGSGLSPAGTGAGRVLFIGAVHEAEPALAMLLEAPCQVVGVVTLAPEKAAATAGFIDLAPMAHGAGVPLLTTTNLNAPDEVEKVRALQPDLIVVVGWTRLLGDALLQIPGRGCIGFHASLLPHNRGRAPVNWGIIHGEKEGGNTMMQLAAGVDTGDIIDQQAFPIDADDTCDTVYRKVGMAGADMLRRHLRALLDGTAPSRPQDHSQANLLPKRTPAMGIIPWDLEAAQVHDWIRAQTSPYPGAFTCLDGRRVTIWSSAMPAGDEPRWQPEPGTLMGLEGEQVRVQTGTGSILLGAVQQVHEARETAGAWFVRKGLKRGRRFDPVDPAEILWARGLGPKPAAADDGHNGTKGEPK